jgi:hypothetical protein
VRCAYTVNGLINTSSLLFVVCASSVSLLLYSGRPLHVSGLIVAIVIDTVDAVITRRSRTQFREELLETIEQKADTAPTVVWVASDVHVCTTLLCGTVRVLFWRARVSMFGTQ